MPRTILVTGANRGLGRATTQKLALGGHQLILAARDPQKLVVVVRELRELAPGCVLDAVPLDLASLASVRACAETLQQSSIDGLLNNAGVMQQSRVRRQTVDGFEETLQTNVLGPFLLTRLLLPTLERDYEPQRAYKNSKLALLWFTYELARRLAAENVEHVTCSAVCPGFVPATAADSTSGLQRFFLRRVLIHARFATTVEDAANAFVEALTDSSLERESGIFLADHREQRSSDESYDEQKAKRFWTLASRLTGLPDRFVSELELYR